MPTRIAFSLILAITCATNVGCTRLGGFYARGGSCCDESYASCGLAEASCCAPDDCCDVATCGLPDASCGIPGDCDSCVDASCGLADATCGLPEYDACSTAVGCGSPVVGRCRLLQRIRNALCGNYGFSTQAYWSDGYAAPSSDCPSCAPHAHLGGRNGYSTVASRRRPRLSKKDIDVDDELRELRFSEKASGTAHR